MARTGNGCSSGRCRQDPGCAAGETLQAHQHPQPVLPHILYDQD